MIVTIIQGMWKEGSKKKKIIVKVLMITWRYEISNCVLSPQAYLH
jgi:hypothetical protein